jgi:hypothetical protein
MSPGYGGYQTATLPPYYTTTPYDTTSYCTEALKYYIKAPDFFYRNLCCPELLHRIPAVLFFPEVHYQTAEYYTEATKYYITKVP